MRATIDELRAELSERTDTSTAALRSELTAARAEMSERAETGEAALRDQLASAQAEQARLSDLVDALRTELTNTASGLGMIENRLAPAVDDLDSRLRTIDERLSTPMTPPPPIPPPSSTPSTTTINPDVEALNTHLARLDERLAAVDRRVTVVSTELANQLSEMSADIEALDRAAQDAQATARAAHDAQETEDTGDDSAAPAVGVDPELLEELRDAQARLANEQARYQIAFRDDLARLAEQLSRRR